MSHGVVQTKATTISAAIQPIWRRVKWPRLAQPSITMGIPGRICKKSEYGIPDRYAEQLLDGVNRDLLQQRYDSFEEPTTYCYAVASTVGLMSMHIIGYADEEAIPYAIKLGVAL